MVGGKQRNLKEVKTQLRPQPTNLSPLFSDWCAICHDGGDTLYCCDRCPKVYHMNCYVPPLPGEPADDWVCLLCTSIDEILSVMETPGQPHAFTKNLFSFPAANQSSERSWQLVRTGSEALSAASLGNVSALARVGSFQVRSVSSAQS